MTMDFLRENHGGKKKQHTFKTVGKNYQPTILYLVKIIFKK